MKMLIEFDGILADIAGIHHQAHQKAAALVGWSALSRDEFWRLTRTKGPQANLLPGAKPPKMKEYHARFAECAETNDVWMNGSLRPEIDSMLKRLAVFGTFVFITLGSNLTPRQNAIDKRKLASSSVTLHGLPADPRARPSALRGLIGSDRRALLAASTDGLIRAAGESSILAVGIANGSCTSARLHQAGADLVYRDLAGMVASLESGGHDLSRAGLLPQSLDA